MSFPGLLETNADGAGVVLLTAWLTTWSRRPLRQVPVESTSTYSTIFLFDYLVK